MKKKLLKMLSIIIMAALLAIPTSVQAEELVPLLDNINTLDVDMGFDGTAGNVSGGVTRQAGVVRMEGTITLYEKVDNQWSFVDEWSGTTTRKSLGISGDFIAVSGREYKAVMTVTAYRNEGTLEETVTNEIIRTCP